MDNIRGVLFDKDGTLLEFDSIWLPVGISLIEELIKELKIEELPDIKGRLTKVLGIGDTEGGSEGIFLWGTATDISNAIKEEIITEEENDVAYLDLAALIKSKINKLLKEHSSLIKPKGDVKRVLKQLKDNNLYIGLATSDNLEASEFCLEHLNIKEYFDFIGADNGVFKAKPDPEMLYGFCSTCNIVPQQIIMVGDSMRDIAFGNNGNAAISILISSELNKDNCGTKGPDYIINSVEELLVLIENN